MATLKLYKTYSFKHKDPVIDELRTAIRDVGVSYEEIEARSRVSHNTMRGWFQGATRRPQHATVKAVARAIGYDYRLVKADIAKDGMLDLPAPKKKKKALEEVG